MPGKYVQVQEGQSVESIAYESGHYWETVWECPENAELRELRPSAHQLVPGDSLFVPDIVPKTEPCRTGKKHVFRRRGVPSRLRLIVREDGNPQSGVAYVIEIDGVVSKGTTDPSGKIDHPLPPNAASARLRIGDGIGARVMTLCLRQLQPVNDTAGVQARLSNLGYGPGAVDGELGDATRAAIRAFQKAEGLDPTGEPDDALRARLVEKHGS
ncbi:MAG TPA: peptidoglycan-binding protein [Thermoanaerobaculia bacterium]|nr:peptidoglycan-binding protein [Thermoanaerobaculia bacterium]